MGEAPATPAVICKDLGPYIVSGLTDLKDPQGNPVPTKPTIALCRCGGSSKKPFCDGTHAKNGFDSAKQPDRAEDKIDTYVGKNITIHDNRSICAHAGVCTDNLAAVWRMNDEPWIDPDGADAASIVAVIEGCPSGALSYTVDPAPARADAPPSIQALKDGPYLVIGEVALEGEDWGHGANRGQYTLCRCGASKNKPFCDGSHWAVEFKDDGSGAG